MNVDCYWISLRLLFRTKVCFLFTMSHLTLLWCQVFVLFFFLFVWEPSSLILQTYFKYMVTPGLGRSPGKGKGCPLQYSGLENTLDCIVLGLQRVGHNWETFTTTHKLSVLCLFLRRKSREFVWALSTLVKFVNCELDFRWAGKRWVVICGILKYLDEGSFSLRVGYPH